MAKEEKERAAPQTWWRKAWHFLWYEDSLASWIVNIILAFIIIKFVFYPGLGLLLGTSFPVVAVVSESMEHHPGSFEEWWLAKNEFSDGRACGQTNEDFYLNHNITRFDFLTYPFRKGFNKGDIMILGGVNPETVKKGTVIVYWSGKPYPIIHRYIGNNVADGKTYLTSKGDNNCDMAISFDPDGRLDEWHIPQDALLGKAVLRIPYLGWVKILAVDAINAIF